MTAATVNGESSFQPEQTFISPPDEFLYGLGQFQEGIWNWRGMPQQLRQLNTRDFHSNDCVVLGIRIALEQRRAHRIQSRRHASPTDKQVRQFHHHRGG